MSSSDPSPMGAPAQEASRTTASLPARGPGPSAPRMSAAMRLLRGFLSPIGAIAFLFKHPTMLTYFVVPAIVNMVLFVGLLALLMSPAGHWIVGVAPAVGVAHVLVSIGLWTLWLVAAFVTCLLAVTILGNLLAYPFNANLSAHIVELVTGVRPPHSSLADGVRALPAELVGQAKKWLVWALLMLALIAFHLVPVVGPMVAGPLGVLISAWFFGLEYIEYPIGAQGYPGQASMKYARRHKSETVGLGLWMFLTLPFLGWIVMPLCVAGATIVYLEDPMCPMRDG